MTTEYYVPEWMLKRPAKHLSRQIDISHSDALDALAFELGFRDWKPLRLKGNYCPSEEDAFDWISKASDKITSALEAELSEADNS